MRQRHGDVIKTIIPNQIAHRMACRLARGRDGDPADGRLAQAYPEGRKVARRETVEIDETCGNAGFLCRGLRAGNSSRDGDLPASCADMRQEQLIRCAGNADQAALSVRLRQHGGLRWIGSPAGDRSKTSR